MPFVVMRQAVRIQLGVSVSCVPGRWEASAGQQAYKGKAYYVAITVRSYIAVTSVRISFQ